MTERHTHRRSLILPSGAALLALALVLCGGCRKAEKLTLRQAEGIASAWLSNVQGMLFPPPPKPKAKPENEDAEGAENAEAANAEEDETLAEDGGPPKPKTLRDCFVDDGWSTEGFKNPTEAIAWLTGKRRPLGRVTSVDIVDGMTEVAFEVGAGQPVTLVARVVMEGGLPKCNYLKQGGETKAAGTKAAASTGAAATAVTEAGAKKLAAGENRPASGAKGKPAGAGTKGKPVAKTPE